MLIFESTYADVSVDKDKSLGMVKWKSSCNHEEYKKAFNSILDVQQKFNIIRYISDIRNQGVVSTKDRLWFEKEALPRAISNGLIAAAVIVDGSILKTYFVNFIMNSTRRKQLPIKSFTNYQDAENWVMSKL